jgi:bacteriorhodopsin
MASAATAGAITDTVPFHPQFQPTGVLTNHDVTGMTFYIAQNMMLAFAVFFFVQVSLVPRHWRTSVCTAGLVTGVAWYNYTRMSQTWVDTYNSPTTFRYTDWLVTVPLQICEFFFILKASGPTPSGLGLQMFLASIVMVAAGWVAEIDIAPKMVGFSIGMICWLYSVYQVSAGEAYELSKKLPADGAAAKAFASIRTIVAIGWTIYPIGFALAYLCYLDQPAGNLSNSLMAALNIIYNIADLVNKGAFGMAVFQAAASDRDEPMKMRY